MAHDAVAMDWNGDGLTDLIVLDQEGYLAYYERFRTPGGELLLRPGRRIFHGTNCSLYSCQKRGGGGHPKGSCA